MRSLFLILIGVVLCFLFWPLGVAVIALGVLGAVAGGLGDLAGGVARAVGRAPCPYCREEISRDALRCPHCRSDLTAAGAAAARVEARGEGRQPARDETVYDGLDHEIVIDYVNAEGEETSRGVTVRQITALSGRPVHVRGACHRANAVRNFRVDRIRQLVDRGTGQVLEHPVEIEGYFRDLIGARGD